MVHIVDGDLLKSDVGIIVHQCNAQGVMGSGVAKQIATLYPTVEKRYKEFIKENSPYGYNFVMGKVVSVPVYNDNGRRQVIYNIIGQVDYGRDGKRYTSYRHLFQGILRVLVDAELYGQNIALPYKIGCCRGGGDWDNVVYPFIKTVAEDFKNDIYIYRLDEN